MLTFTDVQSFPHFVQAGRTYVCYAQRPEWADVTPVPQDEEPRAVVRIAYSERYTDCMNFLRAVMLRHELSQRALELTQDCLEMNSANYTVWHYRRQLLLATTENDAKLREERLRDEMAFVALTIDENSKNYQVWHHRRWLVQQLNDASAELAFTLEVFEEDAKNYHAWEHRQWVVREFNLWDDEIDACRSLLTLDRRNNSAWSHLYFVLTRGGARNVPIDATQRAEFTELAAASLRHDPDNESPWSFLRGLHSAHPLHEEPALWSLTEELVAREDEERILSPHVYAFLVDLLSSRMVAEENRRANDLQRALAILVTLANELDVVRSRYWNYLRRKLLIRFGKGEGNERGDES